MHSQTYSQTAFTQLTYDAATGHRSGRWLLPEFHTESGVPLTGVEIQFDTWGELNTDRTNAVVVCHALTGDGRVAGSNSGQGWWSDLVGPGRLIDTRRFYVIASNVLGGCSGSTGPASDGPDGQPYGVRFPFVTVRDMVNAQIELVKSLNVCEVALCIGASLGGMQAWEWPLLAPDLVRQSVVVAAHSAFPPLAMGYNYAMRQAIMTDPQWRDGDYRRHGTFPMAGMNVARSIGMLTYRSDVLFRERFARAPASGRTSMLRALNAVEPVGGEGAATDVLSSPLFEVESYLAYQGQRLSERFDANSYLYLTRAMDCHDIGRGRGGIEAALSTMRSQLTIVAIDTDYLYSVDDLRADAKLAQRCGVACRFAVMESKYGHDAFLVEQNNLGEILEQCGVLDYSTTSS